MTLARRAPMRRTPTRRSTAAHRIPASVRAALHERAMSCCEVCGTNGATNAHHRVNQSQGGHHTLGNLMLACGSGTTGCHGRITTNPTWAKQHGYTVPATYTPNDIPVTRWSRWTGQPETVLLDDRGGITLTDRTPGLP